ncbi:MAG: hypothetical protein ABIN67_22005, partial [Ferruginibacter sp.]
SYLQSQALVTLFHFLTPVFEIFLTLFIRGRKKSLTHRGLSFDILFIRKNLDGVPAILLLSLNSTAN